MEAPFKKAFVVAAHPDDDVIGCGGLLWKIARAGGEVCVCYLTDGSRSHPGSVRYPPSAVAELRAREARAALHVLGITQEPLFFELADGSLARLDTDLREHAIERLARAIEAFEPEIVLAPWRRDPHPDHAAAAAIAAEALGTLGMPPAFAGYEVWLPIRGSRADHPQPGETATLAFGLDPEARDRKRRAILAHRTQTTAMIDDDPEGFHIDEALLQRWLGDDERLHAMEPRFRSS